MAKRWLALLLILYLALAAAYAAVIPFGQAPDETAHALYIEHLVHERRLPVLRKERREAYEFHQPPLYYVLAAPAWAVADLTPRPPSLPGKGEQGSPLLSGEGSAELGTPASRMAARSVSILIGAVGVWLIWALARAGWPGREALALAAAGFAALLPMRLATAASVSNDSLTEAVFTAALLLMVLMVRQGPDLRRAAVLGALLGLGVLTKSSDLLLFPVAAVALLLACRSEGDGAAGGEATRRRGEGATGGKDVGTRPVSRSPRHSLPPSPSAPAFNSVLFLRCAAVTFGVALLIGGWWMVRNALLYGDPLGTAAFEQYFQDTPTAERMAQFFGYSPLELLQQKVLPLTFVSFWGVFKHMTLFMGAYPRNVEPPSWALLLADRGYPPPSWLYPLLLLVSLVAVAGLIRSGVQAFRRTDPPP